MSFNYKSLFTKRRYYRYLLNNLRGYAGLKRISLFSMYHITEYGWKMKRSDYSYSNNNYYNY